LFFVLDNRNQDIIIIVSKAIANLISLNETLRSTNITNINKKNTINGKNINDISIQGLLSSQKSLLNK